MIILDVILIFISYFAQNVNCVYTVLTGTQGLCFRVGIKFDGVECTP